MSLIEVFNTSGMSVKANVSSIGRGSACQSYWGKVIKYS